MNPLSLISLEPVAMAEAVLLMLVLVTLFLLFGVTAAGVHEINLVDASVVAISMLAAQFVVVLVLSPIPIVGGILGFIFGVVVMVWVIKAYLDLAWEMAAKVWGLAVVAEITTGMILWLYMGIGLADFIHRFFFIR